MRFAFTPDQALLRDAIRDVLKRECPPAVVRAAWEGSPANALWHTLAGVGVAGLGIDEAHGGLGLGALDWILVLEECGRFAAPVPLLETSIVAGPMLQELEETSLGDRWSRPLAKGEARVAIGFAATPFVRDAEAAHLLLLPHADEIHAVTRAQVSLRDEPSVDRSRRLSRVTWTPAEATCVARGERSRRALDEAFDRGALGAGAELLGLASRMIEMAVEYTKVRKQFGAPIGSFQAVKHHLANALVKLEFARPAVYRAAHSLVHVDADRAVHVSMAKACASDAAVFAARASLQCHGAIGYSFEHDLHLWMKRAWALAAAWGDAAWHRERVARVIVDSSSASVAV